MFTFICPKGDGKYEYADREFAVENLEFHERTCDAEHTLKEEPGQANAPKGDDEPEFVAPVVTDEMLQGSPAVDAEPKLVTPLPPTPTK